MRWTKCVEESPETHQVAIIEEGDAFQKSVLVELAQESVYINVLTTDLNVSGLAMLATGGMCDGW